VIVQETGPIEVDRTNRGPHAVDLCGAGMRNRAASVGVGDAISVKNDMRVK
jgi:hypothetical protein